MLLKQIFEGDSYKSMIPHTDKLVEILRNGYSEYFRSQSEYVIFRGATPTSSVGIIVNPKVEGRASANTTNEYTLLMSNDPLWSKYPKRSESIICSTSEMGSSSYGRLYMVIPPDSFRFGVVPASDVWYGFEHGISNLDFSYMDQFNNALRNMIFKIFPDANLNMINTYEGLKKALEEITYETLKTTSTDRNRLYEFIRNKLKTNPNINAYDVVMNEILHPEKNGFWVLNSNTEFSKLPDATSEIWTDNTCILINSDANGIEFKDLQKRVLER